MSGHVGRRRRNEVRLDRVDPRLAVPVGLGRLLRLLRTGVGLGRRRLGVRLSGRLLLLLLLMQAVARPSVKTGTVS